MVRVLVVEDTLVGQNLLVHVLERDPQIHVVGTASDGKRALEFLAHAKPDVIVMDIHMPHMDGFQATKRIMETNPVPIIIVSSTCDPLDADTSFRAMEAGAVSLLAKPVGFDHPEHDRTVGELVRMVKLMAEVKVVTRKHRQRGGNEARAEGPHRKPEKYKLLAIGASVGGPPILRTILQGLPEDFPAPVLIVQHISTGFLDGLVDWLRQMVPIPVHIARHQDRPLPGNVYFAPNDFHMGVDDRGHILLSKSEPEDGLRPSVGFLFRSIANTVGNEAVGVLLTGMGRDGAKELLLMREKGAFTFVQDENSCVVFGMPGEAVRLGAAMEILTPEKIVEKIQSLFNSRMGQGENSHGPV